MAESIRVLYKQPGMPAVPKIIENTLEASQQLVGGFIEVHNLKRPFCLVCNEEGRLQDLPPNVYIEGVGWIVGPIFIAKSPDEDFTTMTMEDIRTVTDWMKAAFA